MTTYTDGSYVVWIAEPDLDYVGVSSESESNVSLDVSLDVSSSSNRFVNETDWTKHTDSWMKLESPCATSTFVWDGSWPIENPPRKRVGPSITAHYMGKMVEIVWNNEQICVRASKIKKTTNMWYIVIYFQGEVFRRTRVVSDEPLVMIWDNEKISKIVTHLEQLEETFVIGTDLWNIICT
jgi:hypothetical protein